MPFLLVFSSDFSTSAVLSILFGCTQSAFWCLMPPIVVDMMGLEQLPTAFGVLTFTQGLACLLGPPLGGVICDITGTVICCQRNILLNHVCTSGLFILFRDAFRFPCLVCVLVGDHSRL